jgi:hypothetical protein
MMTLYLDSLYKTVDATQSALFFFQKIGLQEKKDVSQWLADRQGLPGSYRGMFAPTEQDFTDGIQVFTGEKVTSRAAIAHILSEEACRLLLLLGVKSQEVTQALQAASDSMLKSIKESAEKGYPKGRYCCGICSVSLWRHLSVGGLPKAEGWLETGTRSLVENRDGNGRWRSFPFYYTLLALSEIEPTLAKKELNYAAPAVESAYKRLPENGEMNHRRRTLLERLLAVI